MMRWKRWPSQPTRHHGDASGRVDIRVARQKRSERGGRPWPPVRQAISGLVPHDLRLVKAAARVGREAGT